MTHEWFIIRGGKESGPITTQQLKTMAATGQLQPDDMVRRSDMQATTKATSIKGLFATVLPASAKPPSPPLPEAEPPPATQKTAVPSKKSLMIASVIGGVCLFLCCGGFAIIGLKMTDTARKELTEADALWDKGDKAGAVGKYRDLLGTRSSFLKEDDRARVYGRVIDADMENGNMDSAKKLIAEAIERKVEPAISHPDAKTALAAARRETEASTEQQPGSATREAAGSGLSAQFLPSVPGNVKRYEEEVYDPVNGRALVYSEDEETYGKDGTLAVARTIKSPGVPPSRVSYRGERRQSNGYVELTYIDSHQNKAMSMRVKLGANPGDQWSDARGEGTYRFVRFNTVKAHGVKGPIELTQAVVEHRWEAVDGRGDRTTNVTEIVLEREGGVQSEKAYMLFDGQKKLVRHRRLISSTYP